MANFDDFKLSVEALSGGKNTVLLDDLGLPSVMVILPKMKISDIMDNGSETVHPGFQVETVEKDVMYVSKYQNIVVQDRAYSLAGQDPRTGVNFDQAVQYCRSKGKGWSLMPYSLWSAIALWCQKNNTMPRGNNNYGSDHANPHEKGVPSCALDGNGKVQRTATGSGPATWYHDWSHAGIADLNGNVWEWCAGLRLNNGEINIIPYANVMLAETSLVADSNAWKAIDKDGRLIAPGESGSLKWDLVSDKLQLTNGAVSFTKDEGHGCQYKDMTIESGLATAPELAKALLLYPDKSEDVYGGDYHWANTHGERLVICGGHWLDTGSAGVFGVHLSDLRSSADGRLGFRSAYCKL